MKLSRAVKPVSYIKAHAAEIIRDLGSGVAEPVIITQNGEAKAVLLGVEQYEEMRESLAMLRLLAMSSRDVQAGRVEPVEQVFEELRRAARGE